MPAATPQAIRRQIAQRKPDPLYLILGDDEAEMSTLAADLSSLVEDELRAFNLERIYAGEKGVTPESIVESARTLPMMGDRRVIIVLRAEKILKPKRRGKAVEEEEAEDDGEPAVDVDRLESYVLKPEPLTTLVFVAADVDRGRRLTKTLLKHATIIECWGLKASAQNPRDVKGWELERIAREAQAFVKRAVEAAGLTVEDSAAKLLARRAGADIAVLRGDIDRLLLYVAGTPRIELKDVREVVSGETSQDDWAVTTAIERGDTPEALRQLGLALDGGAVPYQVLGQLGWCVRTKLPASDLRRVPAAVDALFRTDLELKSSGGDPRVLLERLVVDLCRGR